MNFDKLISIAAMVADAKSVANLTATDGSTEVDMYPSSSNIAPGVRRQSNLDGFCFCRQLKTA